MSDPPHQEHTVQDLLRELFPDTHRELFGDHPQPLVPPTLGLYRVADGRLALVQGHHLAEFVPLDAKGKSALHCDLCHYTRSRSEAAVFRVLSGPRQARYYTLCTATESCQARAGRRGLEQLAHRVFPLNAAYADDH